LKKDKVEENKRLRKTEKAINKLTIIIHSCLHFIISITSFIWKINNVYALFTHHYCCHLHQLHITYIIYNVIYTHYNWRWIIIQLKVSFFLVFLQRFEDFYWKLLEWINECTSSFTKVNKDIRLIIKSSFHIYILTQLNYSDWIFWFNLILISSQSLIWVLNLTRQAIEYDIKRAKYRNFSGFSSLHYLFALPFW